MKEGADIKIGGKSLSEAIEKIEERLGILNPNPKLEERWDKLKELRKQYMELEKDLLEKEKIMEILKKE
jgi:predicted nuclease with TOPRIM domain